jgi:hypothetical protein
MATTGSLNVQLSGFPAANRDAQVTLTNAATGQTITRSPFLDGSLMVRDLDPGIWQMKVIHPNLVTPIYQAPIRVFPQLPPTFVPVPIPPAVFQDTPIATVPEANLGPVQQALTSIRDSIVPVQGKSPGEVIRAADWNVLASAVQDIASNVLQLTNLISPIGHTHPEIADKIEEVQTNLTNFAQSFGQTLLQIERELETENLRQSLAAALDQAQASQATRDDLLGRVDSLNSSIQADPIVFTTQLSNTGNRVLTSMSSLITSNPAVANNASVQKAQRIATQYATSGTATTAASELNIYRRTTSVSGNKLATVLGK